MLTHVRVTMLQLKYITKRNQCLLKYVIPLGRREQVDLSECADRLYSTARKALLAPIASEMK